MNILLTFPTNYPSIQYPAENIMYYGSSKISKALFNRLLSASGYRCMYCGSDLAREDSHDIFGEFEKEHTIERSQNGIEPKFLKECKFNFSVACPTCNKNKAKNIIYIEQRNLVIDYDDCLKKECRNICRTMNRLMIDYLNNNKIIVQPHGVFNNITNRQYLIEYDALEKVFIPSTQVVYTEVEKAFIQSHIDKFRLNRRNLKILNKVIDEYYQELEKHNTIKDIQKRSTYDPLENNYFNIIDDIFIDYINSLSSERQKRMIIKKLHFRYLNLRS